jgi:hypothetical protein
MIKKSKTTKVKIKESVFLRSLVKALKLSGVYVYRQNVIRGEFNGRFLSSGIPEGSSDLVTIFKPYGVVVWIECKSSTGVLRDTQIIFRDTIQKLGALYYVASPKIPLQKTLEELSSLVDKKHQEIANKFAFKLR